MAKIRTATPTATWETEYTDEHKRIKDTVIGNIESVAEGGQEDPLAVVGPYGSGKTQLLYEAFQIAWKQGIPALYTDARTLFREFEEADESGIEEWLEDRIQEQVHSIRDTNQADWLPSYSTATDRNENISELSENVDFDSIDTCVLLIDEVEQAYEKLGEQIETDDDNALRVILDDVEGVYQIWSFGLVSAYEILGEADIRRFEEVRIPILDVGDVQDLLGNTKIPKELANGIWWLSRGRVGWARKLLDEGPESLDEVSTWIRDRVSEYEFDGVRILAPDAYTERISQSEHFDAARRATVFLEDGYEDWKVNSSRAITANAAGDIVLDIMQSPDMDPDAVQMLERNIDRLMEAFSPNITWSETSEKYLPPTIFMENRYVDAYFELLEDFILSFEPRGPSRDTAIDILQAVEIESFRELWMDKSGTRAIDDHDTWSIKPTCINDAYPPVAVNPDRLTDYTNTELYKQQTSAIRIEPNIPADNMDIDIWLCPTEQAFRDGIATAESNEDITKMNVLIRPGKEEAEWETSGWASRLENFHLIYSENKGGERLWNFILQLNQYIEDDDKHEPPLSEKTISSIKSGQIDREVRNTIDALYTQVNRIVRNTTVAAEEEFRGRYSLRDSDTLLWAQEELEGDTPFWGYTGSANSPRIGLSYALAFSEVSEEEMINYPNIVEGLIEAYDQGYIQKAKFPYKEFLDKFFTEKGVRKRVRRIRSKYGADSGALDPSLRRLGDLLVAMSNQHAESQEELFDTLTQMDGDDTVSVIAKASTQLHQAPGFLWGILLYKSAQFEGVDIPAHINDLNDSLNQIERRLKDTESDIEVINDVLTPPEDVGRSFSVSRTEVENHLSNVEMVQSGLEKLYSETTDNQKLLSIGLAYSILVGEYRDRIRESVGSIEGGVTQTSVVFDVQDLKSEYKDLRSAAQNKEEVHEYLDMNRDEVNEELQELGDDIFNFYSIPGNDTISPDSEETLRNVSQKATEDLAKVQSLAERFEKVESKLRDRNRTREELTRDVREFLSITLQGGDQ